jgi:hypothetical protein
MGFVAYYCTFLCKVAKRLRRMADKQGPNLPPELPNWSRSAFFPVIEGFPVHSKLYGECLLREIFPGPITRQRLRESLGVAGERWRIQPYGPKR